jgi:deoxyribonuclease-4
MGMLLLGAHMSIAGGVSQALDRAASVGSNAVQVFCKNNRQWAGPPVDTQDVTRWGEQRTARAIDAAISHASYLINLASPRDDLWTKSLHAQRDEICRAHAYGIPGVVVHPGAHMGTGAEAGIRRIATALNRIHADTPDCRDTPTLLEITAGQGTTLGRSLAELQQIRDLVEDPARVGVCLDTCHAFAAGYDLRDDAGYAAFMDELAQTVGVAVVRCWHFNDSKGKLGSHVDRHTHIGDGELGDSAFGRILNDPRWDGIPMLLETPKEDDLQDDIKNLHRLAGLVANPQRLPLGLRAGAGEETRV